MLYTQSFFNIYFDLNESLTIPSVHLRFIFTNLINITIIIHYYYSFVRLYIFFV